MRFAQGGRAAGTSVVAAWLTASSTRLQTWPRNPPSSPANCPSSAAQGTSASLTRTRRAASACAAAVAAPLAAACASHQHCFMSAQNRPKCSFFYRSTSRACSWESVHGSCVHGLSLKTCMHMAEQLRAGPALRRSRCMLLRIQLACHSASSAAAAAGMAQQARVQRSCLATSLTAAAAGVAQQARVQRPCLAPSLAAAAAGARGPSWGVAGEPWGPAWAAAGEPLGPELLTSSVQLGSHSPCLPPWPAGRQTCIMHQPLCPRRQNGLQKASRDITAPEPRLVHVAAA